MGPERLELLGIFFEEAKEHLTAMESTLLALENNPDDPDLLNQIFRSAHSVKGSSGAVGLDGVRRYTHALEGLLQQLREGTLTLSPALADTLLRATDVLEAMLLAAEHGAAPPDVSDMLAEIEAHGGGPKPLAEDSGMSWGAARRPAKQRASARSWNWPCGSATSCMKRSGNEARRRSTCLPPARRFRLSSTRSASTPTNA